MSNKINRKFHLSKRFPLQGSHFHCCISYLYLLNKQWIGLFLTVRTLWPLWCLLCVSPMMTPPWHCSVLTVLEEWMQRCSRKQSLPWKDTTQTVPVSLFTVFPEGLLGQRLFSGMVFILSGLRDWNSFGPALCPGDYNVKFSNPCNWRKAV